MNTKVIKQRNDAWTEEHDLLLAETVLANIREGRTQLAAFEEVGDKLNRTTSACAYRFNNEIRSRYLNAISLAKKVANKRKMESKKAHNEIKIKAVSKKTEKTNSNPTISKKENEVSITEFTLSKEVVIEYLRKNLQTDSPSTEEFKTLKEENMTLQTANTELQEQIKKFEQEFSVLHKQLKEYKEDLMEATTIINKAVSISGRLSERREFLSDRYEEEMKIAQ